MLHTFLGSLLRLKDPVTGELDLSVYNETLKDMVHSHPAHQRFLDQSASDSQQALDEHETAFMEIPAGLELYQLLPPEYHSTAPTKSSIQKEMDDYLSNSHRPGPQVDVLKWWKNQQDVFPHLSSLVRKIFCITSTSASCERVFSAAGQVCTSKRYNLDPETIQKLTFIHDNYEQVDIGRWRLHEDEDEVEDEDNLMPTQEPIAGPSQTSTPVKGTLSGALKNKGQPKN